MLMTRAAYNLNDHTGRPHAPERGGVREKLQASSCRLQAITDNGKRPTGTTEMPTSTLNVSIKKWPGNIA